MSSHPPDGDSLPRALVQAWRGESLDAARVGRAYLRFVQRRTAASAVAAPLGILRWVLLGVAIGMGSLYAATGPLHIVTSSSVHAVPRPQPLPLNTRGKAPAQQPRSDEAPPALLLPQAASTGATSASAVTSVPASEQWQRAARGLRARDFAAVSAALDELSRRGGDEERESAELVRAQLLLAQGRNVEASRQLHALEQSGRSSLVRREAARLLSGIDTLPPSQRSFGSVEGTKPP